MTTSVTTTITTIQEMPVPPPNAMLKKAFHGGHALCMECLMKVLNHTQSKKQKTEIFVHNAS